MSRCTIPTPESTRSSSPGAFDRVESMFGRERPAWFFLTYLRIFGPSDATARSSETQPYRHIACLKDPNLAFWRRNRSVLLSFAQDHSNRTPPRDDVRRRKIRDTEMVHRKGDKARRRTARSNRGGAEVGRHSFTILGLRRRRSRMRALRELRTAEHAWAA